VALKCVRYSALREQGWRRRGAAPPIGLRAQHGPAHRAARAARPPEPVGAPPRDGRGDVTSSHEGAEPIGASL